MSVSGNGTRRNVVNEVSGCNSDHRRVFFFPQMYDAAFEFLLLRHAANSLIVFNSLSACTKKSMHCWHLSFFPHVICKAVDVGVPELLARHEVWRALEDNSHLLWQLPFRFFLAAHSGFLFS
jgi:hypothetical protein